MGVPAIYRFPVPRRLQSGIDRSLLRDKSVMTGDSCARSIAEVRDLVGALLTTSRHTRTAARQTVNMSVTIRTIEAEECPLWRNLRLRALADSPDAFRSTLDEESKIGQYRIFLWDRSMRQSLPPPNVWISPSLQPSTGDTFRSCALSTPTLSSCFPSDADRSIATVQISNRQDTSPCWCACYSVLRKR